MQAYNYMAAMPDISQAFTNFGNAMANYNQRVDEEKKQQQFATDLADAQKSGDQAAYLNLALKYPKSAQSLLAVRDEMKSDAAKNEFKTAFEISTSLENKDTESALKTLDTNIEALKNSNKPTQAYDKIRQLIVDGKSDIAQSTVNNLLFMADPERYTNYVRINQAKGEEQRAQSAETRAQELHKPQVATANAQATTATVTATNAEENAKLDIVKKQEDIKSSIAERNFKGEQIKLQRQKNAIDREANDIARQQKQVEYDIKKKKYDDAVEKDTNNATSAYEGFQNTRKVIADLQGTSPYVLGRTVGPIVSKIPTITPGAADFNAKLATLKSNTFLENAQKMRGMGNMSDRDAKMLENALANLTTNQSSEQLMKNIKTIDGIVGKSMSILEKKYGFKPTPTEQPTSSTSKSQSTTSSTTTTTQRKPGEYKPTSVGGGQVYNPNQVGGSTKPTQGFRNITVDY